MEIYSQLAEKVESGDMASVKSLVEKALSEKAPVEEILNKGLVAGMESIGKKFKENIVFVPEVLVAARAMKAGLELIKPLLASSGAKRANKIVIGTVKGDLHDILRPHPVPLGQRAVADRQLGDLPVLTKGTPEIAPHAGHGE